MFGITSCFAICLRSKHTGNDDYVLEFCLPTSITDSSEQHELGNSILAVMKLHFQSLRVAFGKVVEEERTCMEIIDVPKVENLDLNIESNNVSPPTNSIEDLTASFRYLEIRDFAYAYQTRLATPSMVVEQIISTLEDFKTCQCKPSASVLPYVGVVCLGAILFGYHLGVVNGALDYLSSGLGISRNTVLQGWVVSTLLAGATVGSFTGGSLANKFGRTKTFQLDVIPLAIGAFACATAQSVQTMMIGRLLCGIEIGISFALMPLYISEISLTKIWGALGSVNQLFICIGILAALVVGLPLAGNPRWWRTMFRIAVVPSFLLALGMALSPESPRWLLQ
ncbi:hypothetical protein Nepgr_029866 [Nepenthes gracilis]|uniref:Major facilitator superfamily (MFS) profile domain-containing protein n=1 Tax=Nepenthes gracilis TaxID=150966 RepID=A0AAD3TDB7_NEPGR|nr:hypothetical protein Nepgr_029866 [Nepenthes gracilis]